eukprot:2116735-Pyramimonas_sp.AAC.1
MPYRNEAEESVIIFLAEPIIFARESNGSFSSHRILDGIDARRVQERPMAYCDRNMSATDMRDRKRGLVCVRACLFPWKQFPPRCPRPRLSRERRVG